MFKDIWIPKETTFTPICINRDLIDRKVSKFIDPNGEWNLGNSMEGVLLDDCEIIRRISINLNIEDKIIWHYDRTGKYTVKSGYKLFMKSRIEEVSSSNNIMSNIWRKIWKLKIPSKIKHFCWKIINEMLPTRLNLYNRGLNIPMEYPICKNNIESSDHILFCCPRAEGIWKMTIDEVFLGEVFSETAAWIDG